MKDEEKDFCLFLQLSMVVGLVENKIVAVKNYTREVFFFCGYFLELQER